MIQKPTILDGKALADKICLDLKDRVTALKDKGISPALTIVTASEDPASKIYVRNKIKRCDEIGILCEHIIAPRLTKTLMESISEQKKKVIIQMPFESDEVSGGSLWRYMTPEMDVDGFVNMKNIADLASGKTPVNAPCTPLGIMRLLKEYAIPLQNTNVVVFGRSNIVGRPVARMLEHEGANVTILHSKTGVTERYQAIRSAHIIISATGVLNTITYDLMRDCCYDYYGPAEYFDKVFVDVGMNRDENGKLCGDIAQDVKDHSRAYTPVPGGIGPMTVAMLMSNVVEVYERNIT